MQTINVNTMASEVETPKPRLILFKCVAVGSVTLLLSGAIIHLVQHSKTFSQAPRQEQPLKRDKHKNLTPPLPQSKSPIVTTKKTEKLIIVEEGSKAWFCLQNNGGGSCLTRERFIPNYQIISPPKPQKNYEDYLVEYGITPSGDCGRWLNGKPHCTGKFKN